jgi:imidazolonepropionase-like amidohydrolase
MKTLFVNGHIWDGNAEARFEGELLVDGARIEAVSRGHREFSRDDAVVIDACGCTLMPGLVEAHAHLPFPFVTYFTQMDDLPPEDLLITTLHNARLMLEHGFTACIGAGSPRIRSEITIRNEINAGRLPGPRLLASTPTLTATGGLNDTGRLHQSVNPCAWVADGADEIRKAVRLGYREGADVVKLNVSGDDLVGRPSGRTTTYTEEEVGVATQTAHMLGLKVAAHARSTESIKYCARQGVDIIHHADFCDEQALDLLEARKDRVFVSPSIGFLHFLLHRSAGFLPPEALVAMDVAGHMERNIETHQELRRRGIRHLIGGDYGVPWQPHGKNAFDIEAFVKYLGYSSIAALRCATRYGSEAMGRGNDLGLLKPGYLADLLIVHGDPTTDVTRLQDRQNLRGVMKDGKFHGAMMGHPEGCDAT